MQYGPQSAQVAHSYDRIAQAYECKGDHPRAFEAWDKGLAAMIAARGPVHEDVADYMDDIMDLHEELDEYAAALAGREKQLELYREVHGPHHHSLAFTHFYLGCVHSSMENHEAALKAHQKELEIWTALHDSGMAATAQDCIGGVYHDLEQYEEALVWKQRALETDNENEYELSIAETCVKMGDLEAAKRWFVAMEEAAMKSKDRDENTLAGVWNQQAHALLEGGQPELALETWRRALNAGVTDGELEEYIKAQIQELEGS